MGDDFLKEIRRQEAIEIGKTNKKLIGYNRWRYQRSITLFCGGFAVVILTILAIAFKLFFICAPLAVYGITTCGLGLFFQYGKPDLTWDDACGKLMVLRLTYMGSMGILGIVLVSIIGFDYGLGDFQRLSGNKWIYWPAAGAFLFALWLYLLLFIGLHPSDEEFRKIANPTG